MSGWSNRDKAVALWQTWEFGGVSARDIETRFQALSEMATDWETLIGESSSDLLSLMVRLQAQRCAAAFRMMLADCDCALVG